MAPTNRKVYHYMAKLSLYRHCTSSYGLCYVFVGPAGIDISIQVPPAELEAILLHHPKVRDVGVVGLPDEFSGELPLAFVVKTEGQDVTEAELQKYVSSMVSPQKQLRGGIIFVPEIPKNPSGKILRRELKNKLKNYKLNLQ